jgi:hypothetical protein
MSSPTPPTLATICAEGWWKAGRSSPSSAETTRAQNQWMEEIKNDIWNQSKQLISLQVTSVTVMVVGQTRYAMPTDFSSMMTAEVLDGSETGTATNGTSGTLTVASTDTYTEASRLGKELLITGGTGIGSLSQCTAYNDTTKIATVTPNFTTAPSISSTYRWITDVYELEEKSYWDYVKLQRSYLSGRPTAFYPTGSADYGEIILDKAPDITYGFRLRYYANLLTLDVSGTTMATVYTRWRDVFTQGVFAKALQSLDDARASTEMQVYRQMLAAMIGRERYGSELSRLQMTVGDW